MQQNVHTIFRKVRKPDTNSFKWLCDYMKRLVNKHLKLLSHSLYSLSAAAYLYVTHLTCTFKDATSGDLNFKFEFDKVDKPSTNSGAILCIDLGFDTCFCLPQLSFHGTFNQYLRLHLINTINCNRVFQFHESSFSFDKTIDVQISLQFVDVFRLQS